ncbi:fungal-specific transcription factor domain-containing protein [Hypoxylon trugodes]|uniref:fungal-specific transcription factor domain-containing protein n=1 Tax=Hypoxylon trugodes TaxID=326681 RepID=UPI00219A7E4E|nr:fungal-specific transcription factor domain-containing protein [Hypoxylon trugodes]KAI1392649.1 fungal-specific transcription factor domain-containing protein [Hypoxylon trugodes]
MHPSRKACDLCYRKKIKCDGETPRCSPCVIYKSDCTYKASSRKTPSKKQAAAQRQFREDSLQSRIKTLEDQLSTVLEKVDKLEKQSGSEQNTPNSTPRHASEEDTMVANWASSLPPILELPPLQEVLPIVEHYLATFNTIMPLFHSETLLQKIKDWYENSHVRDTVTWAMINVVLALSPHTGWSNNVAQTGNAAVYLNNAQSVLTDVIMGKIDLINIQVLLGIVILFRTADDLRPALILTSTALRLAHRLGLHNRKASEYLCPVVSLQRNRVFWIAYILDRDISLLSRLAPIQLDGEIDLSLPPSEATDDLTGFVFAADGRTKLNFFRARVELARIQGKVYESIYSPSAQNANSEERTKNVSRTLRMLDEWSSGLPTEFSLASLSQANVPELSRYLCLLYATPVSCRALLCCASAWDSYHYSKWVGRVQDYGEQVVTGQVVSHAPTLPHGWKQLVDESREYLKLFATVIPRDSYFIRMTLCAYNSSTICLMANSIISARNKRTEQSSEFAWTDTIFSDDMAEHSYREIRDAVMRLGFYANNRSQMVPLK